MAGGPARVTKTLVCIERFQLVFINWRWCYKDDSGVVGLCCWMLDDGLEIPFIVIQGNMLGAPGKAGIVCTKEYCLANN